MKWMFKIKSPNAFALTLKSWAKLPHISTFQIMRKFTNLVKRFFVEPYLKQNSVKLPVFKYNIYELHKILLY
jgi:hypothetical protein